MKACRLESFLCLGLLILFPDETKADLVLLENVALASREWKRALKVLNTRSDDRVCRISTLKIDFSLDRNAEIGRCTATAVTTRPQK